VANAQEIPTMANHHPYAILRQMRQMAGEITPPTCCLIVNSSTALCATASSAFDHLVSAILFDVFRVCRRLLRDPHAAGTLPSQRFSCWSKGRIVKKHEALPSWLYRVAFALRCALAPTPANRLGESLQSHRKRNAIRRASEHRDFVDSRRRNLRLPERFRTPVLLCYVEGQTRDQTAQQTRWSLRTLQRRWTRPRVVAAALDPCGATLSAALLAPISLNPEPKPA